MPSTVLGDQYIQLPTGTNAQRPASPVNGDTRWNTTGNVLETYYNGAWQQLDNTFSATGGSTNIVGSYKIHTFTSSGTFTVNGLSGQCDILVVAGGGGDGNWQYHNGGSGGGGLVYGTNVNLSPGSYVVTVGAGGPPGDGATQGGVGSNGQNSVFGTIATAYGGGHGGAWPDGSRAGAQGGSGGGGGANGNGPNQAAGSSIQNSPSGFTGYGNSGGNGASNGGGGGGGGAGAGGGAASGGSAGSGGIGRSFDISGTATYYAGGGGGSGFGGCVPGTGGQGGGGNGSAGPAQNGGTNTGGGAGGSERNNGQGAGATGGSGVVIVRYRI